MSLLKMTSTEKKGAVSLSAIMALRMIGLFMVLPVFSLYAIQLQGATPSLVGLAIGVYGLSQALFQIPFGTLSDHFGRKPIICFGLIIFALGSLIAGLSHSIFMMIIGRALQGVGAVGSTLLALLADLTREQQRSKAMAIAGISIGCSFSIALLLGPLLTQWFSVNHLFLIAMLFGLLGILILYTAVPTTVIVHQQSAKPTLKNFLQLFIEPQLLKLNSGIFILHAVFTASFIVIPISLVHFTGFASNKQWQLYLPTLLTALFLTLALLGLAERKQQVKFYFLTGIFLLALAEFLLWLMPNHLWPTLMGLTSFFLGFSILEAFLPSLITRTVPTKQKGSALGIYSCAQFLGIFMGGVLGGFVYSKYSFPGVYFFCIMLTLFWFVLAFSMQSPRYFMTQIWHLTPQSPALASIHEKLTKIPGVIEVTYIAEENVIYLKTEKETIQHPDFIRCKEYTTGTI